MNKLFSFPETIIQQLQNNKPVVTITIVDIDGSSPRHRGAKMIVDVGRKTYGTIGGSIFEAKSIKKASKILRTKIPELLYFEFDEKSSDGMICGGKATVLLDYIDTESKNIALFNNWKKYLDKGKNFYYLIKLEQGKKGLKVLNRALLLPDGVLVGEANWTQEQVAAIKTEASNISSTTTMTSSNSVLVIDPIKRRQTLYLAGAGHVAVPTAQIASIIGFGVVVIDDRDEFANPQRFPDAEKIKVIKDYAKVFSSFEIDRDSYIVIMTRGHAYDQQVLEQALKTPAVYIGMISSRTKRQAVFQALLAQGISQEQLKRVHSPIGISIGSETPEEIAVSIAAELIKVRTEKR
jgi:xanthine dehydrogenase accessory factor